MSKTRTEQGDASTIISDLNDPILWTEVQILVLPKVRQALRSRFHLSANAPDADDAVQSGVRALLSKNNSTDPRDHIALTLSTLEGWLVKTCWRKLNDKYRTKSHRTDVALSEVAGRMLESTEQSPLEQLLAQEEQDLMVAARAQLIQLHSALNEEQKSILQLRLKGESARGISAALKLTRARVSAALAAILTKAKELCNSRESDG